MRSFAKKQTRTKGTEGFPVETVIAMLLIQGMRNTTTLIYIDI